MRAMTARPPQICASPRALDALELLRHGVWGEAPVGPGGPAHVAVPAEDAEAARAAGRVEVVDPEGVPIAAVPVTDDADGDDGAPIVAGEPQWLGTRSSRPFERLHVDPSSARSLARGALPVLLERTATATDAETVRAARAGRRVVLLALAGEGTPDAVTVLRSAVVLARELGDAEVVAVPLGADAPAGTKAEVVAAYVDEEPVALPDPEHGATPLARGPRAGGAPGLVVFFTGLSGSGKSTIARALRDEVLEEGERTVTLLDGDLVRRHLSAGLTFSPADRERNIRRIGWVAAEIAHHGGTAICSPIAPYARTRAEVRETVRERGGTFVLVHVATPLQECERRDRKGLYARARRGEIPDFTGISSPYEEPADADLRVDTTGRGVPEVLEEVLDLLAARDLLHRAPSRAAARA